MALPYLFAATLFLSAFLLFLVQPMIAKMILPALGGTPAVWNTCTLFFQATLLAGYSYAHLLTSRLSSRTQIGLHAVVLALPLLALPIGLAPNWVQPKEANPIPWLLMLLTVSIGLPFFALSTTAPLLQKWFAHSDHPSAQDPYFLYAASNLGSMLSLLGYPVLIEPILPLRGTLVGSQSGIWSIGYGLLAALILICGIQVARSGSAQAPQVRSSVVTTQPPGHQAPTLQVQLWWVGLAFVPSSLMLGVTTYVTLNLAAIPLLWVIPLTLYLLSFIVVFAKWPAGSHRLMIRILPILILILAFTMVPDTPNFSLPITIALHFVTLFVASLVCHGELARTRPSPAYLTNFYMLMSAGGVFGGLFNGLLAPVLFKSILEYKIVLVVAALLLPADGWGSWLAVHGRRWYSQVREGGWSRDCLYAGTIGSILLFASWIDSRPAVGGGLVDTLRGAQQGLAQGLSQITGFDQDEALASLLYGPILAATFLLVGNPRRFGLTLGAILLAGTLSLSLDSSNRVLFQDRSFFGVLKVKQSVEENSHRLIHGNTIHGAQSLDPARRRESMTYFHRSGPIGQLFASFQGPYAKRRIAVTGLGAGTLANYVEAGQSLTYYEIDPLVVTVALDPKYFTYYEDASQRGAQLSVIIGDGRLTMEQAPDHSYDLIILDAFSSDSVPVHLITKEAMSLYFRKLAPHGMVIVNISNRYLDLSPVLASLATSLQVVGLKQDDDADEAIPAKYGSTWAVMAQAREDFGSIVNDARWIPFAADSRVGVWTDDFSNMLGVVKWFSQQ